MIERLYSHESLYPIHKYAQAEIDVLGRELEVQRQVLAQQTRDGTSQLSGRVLWETITTALELPTTERSVSGALVSLCIFHDEKTPSFWMYPSKNCICHGCGVNVDAADAITLQDRMHLEQLYSRLGIVLPDVGLAQKIDSTRKTLTNAQKSLSDVFADIKSGVWE